MKDQTLVINCQDVVRRVPVLWHPPSSPENEIARDLLRILAHVAQ
jgi:hypothetical protein